MADPRGNAAGFSSLVGSGATYAGVDQGVDFTGGPFDVYALDKAVITRVVRSGSGWSGEGAVVNYRLLSGPKAGQYVYVAEDFAPRADLRPGMVVHKGDSIGKATGSGRAPGIEVGWAQASGLPLAPKPPPRPADQYTPQGADFRQFLAGGDSPGAPGGIVHDINSAARHVPGVAQVEGAAGAVSSVGDFIGRVTDPSYILRGLQIVAGAVMVLAGVVLLLRQVALANDLPDPVGLASKAGGSTPEPETTTVHRIGIRQTQAGNIATSDLGSYER